MQRTHWIAAAALCAVVCLTGRPLLADDEKPEEKKADVPAASTRFLERQDKDGDGKLSREEYPERLRRVFDRVDADGDGFVTLEEDAAWRRARAERRKGRGNKQRGPKVPPTHENVAYGPHERNVFDLWCAKGEKPTPLVIYFHGGGFRGGDKRSLGIGMRDQLLAKGISVGAANYRLTDVAPYPAQMHDAARCVQYLRLNAKKYNLDPDHVGAFGGSAGAGISLWLAFHDDLADAKSADPVLRQSSRLSAAVMNNGQSSYDPRYISKLFDTDQIHPALISFFGMAGPKDVSNEKFFPLFEDASGLTHLSKDDAPVLTSYSQRDDPLPRNSGGGAHIHHPKFGHELKKAMEALGIECILKRREDYEKDRSSNAVADQVAFFARHLLPKEAKAPTTPSAPGGG